MATKQLLSFQDSSGIVTADQAATPLTLVYRDSSGNDVSAQRAGSEIKSTGILTLATVAQAAAFTAGNTAFAFFCNATSAAFAVTLPAAAACAGRVYTFKKIDNVHTVTVTAAGSDTIDGAGTYALTTQYQTVRIISDGAVWWTI
jgi:hypothetical protein